MTTTVDIDTSNKEPELASPEGIARTAVITMSYVYQVDKNSDQTQHDLEAASIGRNTIGVVTSKAENSDQFGGDAKTNMVKEGAVVGAALGAILGAEGGWLTGLGILTVPGVGPIAASDWFVATATGVTVGTTAVGLLGVLIGAAMRGDK